MNLCLIYRIVEASEALLEAAIPRTYGHLRRYYEAHLEEERGHLSMIETDLTGFEIPRIHLAAQLAGSQYYLIRHDHPALLLGYMHCLEKRAPAEEFIERFERELDRPMTFLRHHGIADVKHEKELVAEIEKHPADIQKLIAWNEAACDAIVNQLTVEFK